MFNKNLVFVTGWIFVLWAVSWGAVPSVLAADVPQPQHTVYLPLLLHQPCGVSVSGLVTRNALAAPGLPLQLKQGAVVLAETVTGSNGRYAFAPVSMPAGQSYTVEFVNTGAIADTLGYWSQALEVPDELGCATFTAPEFDVADLRLTAPIDDSLLTLPATFYWQRRSFSPGDRYIFHLIDPTGGVVIWYSVPVGYADRYTLDALPENYQYGVDYYWQVFIEKPDGSRGLPSDDGYRVRFTAAR